MVPEIVCCLCDFDDRGSVQERRADVVLHPASRAHVALPALSWLESWGDYAAGATVLGLMQPAMGPVEIAGKAVEGKSLGDILLSLGRQALGSE